MTDTIPTFSSQTHPFRIIIIVQARMGSTRLPGKILKIVLNKPLLSYEIERLQQVNLTNKIVVATTTNPSDKAVVDFCNAANVAVFQGSEDDVLSRYYQAAKEFLADVVIRVSGDCPLIDPKIIDEVLTCYIKNYPKYDYVSNTLERYYPRGLDVEVFSFKALEKAHHSANFPEEREHVTPYIYRHPEKFNLANVALSYNASEHRWTVDTPEDLQLITNILETLYPTNPHFAMQDVIELLKKHPDWMHINAHIQQKTLN